MTNYPDSAFAGVLEQARDLPKTQILVLASTHLETLTEGFSPRLLDTLVGKLAAYKPDVIAVENLSPDLVAMMESEGGFYAEIIERFASKRLTLAARAQGVLGLERRAAKEEGKRLAAKREAETLEPDVFGRLVLSLVAAYDLNNAALAWGYLSTESCRDTASMNGLGEDLDTYLERPDEVVSIALRLAAQLGHPHVHYLDDHRDAALFELYGERIEEIDYDAVRRYIDQIPALQESRRLLQAGLEAGDLWDLYRYANTPEFMAAVVDAEVGVYYGMKPPSGIDRMRAAQWETRNLYMAGNLRYASALYPGGRVLAVVGWSHKPLLDRYLAELTDVQLVHLGDL